MEGTMGIECPKCNFDNPDDTVYCGKCATPLPSSKEIPVTETIETPTKELTTGSTFAGRYQIIEELGKGGMGKVYKAHDTEIKEKVALKLLKPEIAGDKKTIERFQNELRFARKISHRNVCRMYDLNKEEGSYYITMEYVPGEDLKGMIRMMGQLGAGKSISIAKQVCEGLAEAHRLGVVHRDLKPSNIMIDKEGDARIMDFGIARSVKGKGITGAGVMVGTPEYMSPEQAEVKEVDQRSDIYSLGVILYEMVTGRVPFEGETPLGIAMKHKSEVPKDPRELNAQLAEDLSRVILRCMEKDKEKRYQSAGEVRSELSSIEKGIPTTERIVPKRKPITSKEITVTLGLKKLFVPALVVTLAIITVIIWRFLPRKGITPVPTDKPYIAVLYVLNNTGDKNMDQMRTNISQWMVTDLHQSKYIEVLPMDQIHSIFRKLNLTEVKGYTSEDLRKIAEESGVSHIWQASLSKVRDQFRIDFSIHDSKKQKTIAPEFVMQSSEEPFTRLVDEITKRIKKSLNLSKQQIASDIDLDIGKVTTQNPQALQYYIEGERLHYLVKNRSAIELFEKAVGVDPAFAMAFRMIAVCYGNLDEHERYREYLQKALALKDRLPPREYFLLQGDYYAQFQETYDKSLEMYKKILDLYPDDFLGQHMVGFMYAEMGNIDESIKQYERLIQKGTRQRMVYYNTSWSYGSIGEYEKGRQTVSKYLNTVGESWRFRNWLVYTYIIEGKFDLALQAYKRAMVLEDNMYAKYVQADIHFFQDEFERAYQIYQEFLDSQEEFQWNWFSDMTDLFVSQGKIQKAIDQIESVLEERRNRLDIIDLRSFYYELGARYLSVEKPDLAINIFKKATELLNIDESALQSEEPLFSYQAESLIESFFWEALAYTELGKLTEAERLVEMMKRLIPGTVKNVFQDMIMFLEGKISLERNDLSEAVSNFERAYTSMIQQELLELVNRTWGNVRHALYLAYLAQAYVKSGDLEKAVGTYEDITKLTIGRYHWGDIYAKSFYMLGKIYEQLGDTAKAIEHYEKFLSLWKDADPGIAEVEDAKKRRAAIKGQ
jgi:serine/threonine protein kinase/predicted Zn-dependent protease